ncbi:MAG: hypothetical protein ABI837_07160 [Acidobacteriota bacterium]
MPAKKSGTRSQAPARKTAVAGSNEQKAAASAPAELKSTAQAPPLPDPQLVNARLTRDMAWCRDTLVHAYQSNGASDPRWDASALEALSAVADFWSANPRRTGNELEQAWQSSQKAIRAGCSDPLVLYVNAATYKAVAQEDLDDAVRLYRDAASALDTSRYSPYLRARAHAETAEVMIERARAKESTDARGVPEQIASIRQLLPAIAAAKDTPPHMLIVDLVGSILDLDRDLGSDRKESFEEIAALFAKARPSADVLHALLKARFLVDYAWDARGGRDITHVTENAKAVFATRLQSAERATAKASSLDPLSPVIAPLMLMIELGQGVGRERMESWFHYGAVVDPGRYQIYAQKLHYLEPQWYGSPQEMVAYGRELLALKQWNLKVPFLLALAHFELAQHYEDPSAYYKESPQTCADIRTMYDGYLKLYPGAAYERSAYALTLYNCGDYAAATRQFKALGGDGRIGPFLTRANYDNKRVDAAARATGRP